MTVDEIIQRARRGGYSPGLADDNTMADEVERLRAVEAGHVENIKVRLEQIDCLRADLVSMSERRDSWAAEAIRWRDIADDRLKALDDRPAPDTRLADQAALIASLQGEIGRWATAYNEMHERITTARLALRRVRFNPMETT